MNTYTFKDNDLLLDVPVISGKVSNGREQGKKYVLKIHDLPEDDKPREKLLRSGAGALSTSELLAVVLQVGTSKEGVLEMSQRVVKEYGERSLAHHRNPELMAKDLDIPIGKAMQIVATAELGRRFFDRNQFGTRTIRTAEEVYQYVGDMANLPKEHLRGIYLNAHHRIVHDEVLSIGTVNSNLIHPREVFRPAVEHGSVAVILVHNHPSGVTTPSEADVVITKQLIEAGRILGINILDHVIVSPKGFASVEVDYN